MKINYKDQKSIIDLSQVCAIEKINAEKGIEYTYTSATSYNLRFTLNNREKYLFWYFESEIIRDGVFDKLANKICTPF